MFTFSSRTTGTARRYSRLMRASCEPLESRRLLAVTTEGTIFGATPDDRNLVLQQIDTDGDIVRYSLTGGGMGEIVGNSLVLTGTTARSALTITVRRVGDGLVEINGISSDGLIRTINGRPVIVDGPVALNTTAADTSAFRGTAITLSEMRNATLDAGGQPILTMRLQNWGDSDTVAQTLTAPWIGTLTVTGRTGGAGVGLPGDFMPEVTLTDDDVQVVALRTARVAGTVGSIDAPSGGIKSLTAGAIDGSILGLFFGTIRTRPIAGGADGSATGEIRAVGAPPQANRPSIATVQIGGSSNVLIIRADERNIGNITITGNAEDTKILALAAGARSIRVGQSFTIGRIQTFDDVRDIRLGAMLNSDVLIGFAPEFADDFAATAADFANPAARLNSFTAGRSQAGAAPQISGVNNLSAAQLGSVRIFNLESISPPSLNIFVLTDQGPVSARYTDNNEPANNFTWRRGQPQPTLLDDMLIMR